MLFEIVAVFLLVVLTAYTLAMPLMVVKSIMLGVKLAEKPQETAEKPIFNIPKPKKKPKLSKEDQQIIDIMANVDAYTGMPTGQKEIK